jgi:hypothetical protein
MLPAKCRVEPISSAHYIPPPRRDVIIPPQAFFRSSWGRRSYLISPDLSCPLIEFRDPSPVGLIPVATWALSLSRPLSGGLVPIGPVIYSALKLCFDWECVWLNYVSWSSETPAMNTRVCVWIFCKYVCCNWVLARQMFVLLILRACHG